MSAERRGVRGGAREGERFSLSPPPRWRLALGASLLRPPRALRTDTPTSPPSPSILAEGRRRGTRRPILPGWARVPARRRSLPRPVPPASAQSGAPAPVTSSPPAASPLLLSLPAPRLHARPPPPPLPPRGERRPHSLVPRALLAAAARASPAAGLRPTERTHPGTRTPAAGRTPAHAPRGSAGRRSRADAPPRAPSPGPATAPRRAPGLLSRAPVGALRLQFPPAPWNNP